MNAVSTLLLMGAASASLMCTTQAFQSHTPSFTRTSSTTSTTYSTTSSTTSMHLTTGKEGKPASTPQEDLELTRQIIMKHIASMDGTGTENEDTSILSSIIEMEETNTRTYNTPSPPSNSLMIQTALGQPVPTTPVWLFRQAGRHLPEYHSYKKQTKRSFLQMLQYPKDVAEVTLQPLRRYPLDAAILFSDILVIAQALGIEVTMPGGVGIQVPSPLKDGNDMKERIPSLDQITSEFVEEKLGVVLESVSLIRQKMVEEDISVPLIGFSGAPFTLLYYMVGGSSRKNNDIGERWFTDYTDESRDLLEILTKIIIEYMTLQVERGAHMLQLFEAMGMMLNEESFNEFALPCLATIAKVLKQRFPDVPLMVFSRGASFANEQLSAMGYDVITIDGTVDRTTARSVVDDRAGLQGSYNPAELILANDKTPESVVASTKEYLNVLGTQRLIANLGEGLGGKESPLLVRTFVDAVHEYSSELIQKEMEEEEEEGLEQAVVEEDA